MNKFYISLVLNFKKDCDLNKIEKEIGLKAHKKISFQDSKGPKKLAKLIYKSDEFESLYIDEFFEDFLTKNLNNLEKIPNILALNDGVCNFSIVITSLKEKPCIGLSLNCVNMLSKINASYDVDFI